jgi:hypothetical protein
MYSSTVESNEFQLQKHQVVAYLGSPLRKADDAQPSKAPRPTQRDVHLAVAETFVELHLDTVK